MTSVVHLPFYEDNPYQTLLFEALREEEINPINGGGGGNFFRSVLFRWKPRALHFHWLHPYVVRQSWLGTWLRLLQFVCETALIRLTGCKIVWTVHNISNHDGKHPFAERVAGRWMGIISTAVICHSQYAAREIQKLWRIPPERCKVIPHPNYISRYPVQGDCADRPGDAPNASNNDVTFLFFGRIAPYKGIEPMIAAFRELTSPRVRLLIVGNPTTQDFANQIELLASQDDRIHLHSGYVDDRNLPSWFAIADVVLFPFQNILTSGSLILAMGFAKACIVPRFESLAEVLPDSQETLTYVPHDVAGLRNCMEWAAKSPNPLTEIGRHNRERAETWTWKAMASTCRSIYHPQTAC
ncbi:glycosyltransferase family 4 protein [bacterium]|nr:glycosyltransferase family 4 protein [bacterium]